MVTIANSRAKKGIAANFAFPMPASFIWQLYADNLPDVSQSNQFNKNAMMWRLIRLIPAYLHQPDFQPLRHYLAHSAQSEQFKLYQLAGKIADLFDQYLVYRPDWISAWEEHRDVEICQQIESQLSVDNDRLLAQIQQNIAWQGVLWRALVQMVKTDTGLDLVQHRAHLHRLLLENSAKIDRSFYPNAYSFSVFLPCQKPIWKYFRRLANIVMCICSSIILARNIGAILWIRHL